MFCTSISCKCTTLSVNANWDLVASTLNDNTWIKSADLFPSHRTEFDVSNSHVYTYTNKFLNKVVVSIDLKAATEISSSTGVLSIASNIANIPTKPVFYDINDISNNFEYVILKIMQMDLWLLRLLQVQYHQEQRLAHNLNILMG